MWANLKPVIIGAVTICTILIAFTLFSRLSQSGPISPPDGGLKPSIPDEKKVDTGLVPAIEQVIPPGEEVIDFGKLIVLRPSVDTSKYSSVTYKWVLLDVFPNGSLAETFYISNADGVAFSSGLERKLTHSTLIVTGAYKQDQKTVIQTVIKTKTLTVDGGLPPTPPDPPTPPKPPAPPPKPPEPPEPPPVDPTKGLTVLGKAVYISAKKVDSQYRLAGAKALAESFNGIASAIAAGALKEPKMILLSTKDSNNSSLKAADIELSTWANFSTDLERELARLLQNGSLSTAPDFQRYWSEIAQGLLAIKQ